MYNALTVFHRWLALVTSVVILILALTGSALVFEGAIDRGMHPELWRVSPTTTPLSLDMPSLFLATDPKAPARFAEAILC